MGEETFNQPVWCNDGTFRWSRNVWSWSGVIYCPTLPKIWPKHRAIPWWRVGSFKEKPQKIEKIKKDLCNIFRDNDLKITVEANISTVNILYVTLDLKSGNHYPYTKEGNTPLYVHKKWNRPPSTSKNIPQSINKRLPEISSDKGCFDNAKGIYQEALNRSGYKYDLTCNESGNETPRTRRNAPRNII